MSMWAGFRIPSQCGDSRYPAHILFERMPSLSRQDKASHTGKSGGEALSNQRLRW